MEKVLKIQSANSIIQSFRGDGSTAPSHELLDFKIPNIGEVYDLSKSYISIRTFSFIVSQEEWLNQFED